MGIQRSNYILYGARIRDDTDWFALEDDLGQCCNNGEVGCFRGGAYDRHMMFLAVTWQRTEPGQYTVITAGDMHESRRQRDVWDAALMNTADRLGLAVLDGPGWFMLPSES